MQPIKEYDVSKEKQRDYEIRALDGSIICRIVIHNPQKLFCGPGHAFHRVFDGEITYLCPTPGVVKDPVSLEIIGFCVVSWINRDLSNPCNF